MPNSETETEEEVEEEAQENSSDSEYDDLTIDTQPLIKPSKKPKKAVPAQNSLKKTPTKIVQKSKRVPLVAETDRKSIELESDIEKTATTTKEKDVGKRLGNQNSKEEGRKKYVLFNDNNIDHNLHNEAPQNIKVKKIKLSHSLIVLCQMIEGADMKGSFNNDFAAMTFQKKMKDGKAYEFSLPLSLAPTIQEAAQIMIDANPQFFSGIKKFRE